MSATVAEVVAEGSRGDLGGDDNSRSLKVGLARAIMPLIDGELRREVSRVGRNAGLGNPKEWSWKVMIKFHFELKSHEKVSFWYTIFSNPYYGHLYAQRTFHPKYQPVALHYRRCYQGMQIWTGQMRLFSQVLKGWNWTQGISVQLASSKSRQREGPGWGIPATLVMTLMVAGGSEERLNLGAWGLKLVKCSARLKWQVKGTWVSGVTRFCVFADGLVTPSSLSFSWFHGSPSSLSNQQRSYFIKEVKSLT